MKDEQSKLANSIEKYKDIFFSFLYRDEIYPGVKKIKGFSIRGILSVILESLKQEFIAVFKKNKSIINGKIWLYVESINQLKALEPLLDIENSILVTNSDNLLSKNINSSIVKLYQPTKLKHRVLRFFKLSQYKKLFKENFKAHLNTIIKYDGIYEGLLDVLNKHKPIGIVFSNDHNAFCRALRVAAIDCRIKTVYLQHAAVTDQFPPLKFDLSLLDGQDSFDKYKRAGSVRGKVKLIGMTKFDEYFHLINRKRNVESIGLALNNGDDFDTYFEIFSKLNKRFEKMKYYIRFHPSIEVNKINVPDFFIISYTNKETSFDFLANVDALFSGNSSIHLEATLMNIPSYQIKNEKDVLKDYYGFIQNKLIEEVNLHELFELIEVIRKNKPEVRYKAKYYNAVIETKYDGFSTIKVKNEISSVLKNLFINKSIRN